jgi:hypothetical protein
MRWLYGLAAAAVCAAISASSSIAALIGPTDWAMFKTSDSARYHMLCAYFPKLGAHLSLVR